MVHTLLSRQVVTAHRDVVWDFFSNPRNLPQVTPPGLDFQILTADLPAAVYAGLMIAYRVRPLFRVPVTWLTEITQVQTGEYFIDEQRVGPYAVWHHEHHFHELPGGRIEMLDRITYVLPFGPAGNLVHPWLVQPQLNQIFAFRRAAVARLFPG